MTKNELLNIIGARCREYRTRIDKYLYDVAFDTGYSLETVSGFEHGRNNNGIILLWYIKNGLTIEELLRDEKTT